MACGVLLRNCIFVSSTGAKCPGIALAGDFTAPRRLRTCRSRCARVRRG
jgi:hypothetical protein